MENQELKYVAFYKNYLEAFKNHAPEFRLAIYEAIFDYGFTGIEPQFNDSNLTMAWSLIKPNIDSNITRIKANQENGKKGGRPTTDKKKLN